MSIPTYYVQSVLSIDPVRLVEMGKKTILLDLDNTILPRDAEEMPPAMVHWVKRIRQVGIKVVLVSNSWFGRVSAMSAILGVDFVDKAVKPLPPAFILGLIKERTWPREAAIVGDQFFTDVLGGTFLGMTTIMVLPLAEHDLKHTLILRHLEKRILGSRKPLDHI